MRPAEPPIRPVVDHHPGPAARTTARTGWWHQVREFLRSPDSLMLEIGAGGELLVARLRLSLVLLIMLFTLSALFVPTDMHREVMVGLICALLVAVVSTVALVLARQVGRYPRLSWLTVTTDVTLVTLALTLILNVAGPQGIHRQVAWILYVVSIVLTALRNDARLSVYAGVLSLGQYVLLAAYTMQHYPPEALNNPYNVISWATVGQRVLILIIFTVIITMVVERMHRLVTLAGTDSLRGLPNRTWFFNAYPQRITRAARQGTPLSFSIIDLDHFKAVNDGIGHAAGDRALQHVVQVIREHLSPGEALSRLGGEEFVLALPQDRERATARLNTLREAVQHSTFIPEPGAPPRPLTFSAGLATHPDDGHTLEILLGRADARLYHAKDQGRNRVVNTDAPTPGTDARKHHA